MPTWIVEWASRLRAQRQISRLGREGRSINLNAFVADSEQIALTSIAEDAWNMRLFEMAALCLLARRVGARRVLEIGTFDGRTTINLSGALGDGAKITTVNLPVESYPEDSELRKKGVGYRFAGRAEAVRITQIYSDSASLDSKALGNDFDLVFIDGAHTEEYVKSDTALALDVLARKPESLIVWDDMQYHGVQAAVRQMEESAGFRFHHLEHTKLAFAFPFAPGGLPEALSLNFKRS